MESVAQRAALVALIEQHGESYAALSRRIGRNAAYLQQFVTRGHPRALAERDRQFLARYFGVPEAALGGGEAPAIAEVPRLDLGASAGPGGLVEREARTRPALLSADLLRQLGVRRAAASVIRVAGDSMEPTLRDGDEILVDRDRREIGHGIQVLRADGELLVKRLRRAVGGIELISDNPDYPPLLRRGEDLEVIGRVVWLSRAI
jgi:SOS-response transcriptional repressor LexA